MKRGARLPILTFSLLFTMFLTVAQDRQPAFEMNTKLGKGVNMGNAFEAPSETEWGNPWQPEYFQIMADLGFNHVRLPVRWEPADRSMATPPYTINADFLSRIKQVVDSAINAGLYIIVNMHHHDALFDDPDGQKERFLSQWNQIATYFKDYPENLLFEVLNEPHGNITPERWNEFFADALAEIRKTNPTRVVLLGVADFGGLGGVPHLVLPADEYIILSPHYYNPFNFTHQGAEWLGQDADAWLGTGWFDTTPERETVASEFSYAIQFSQENHIPIHVGEFGAYNKADIASRERWTTFLARWFEQQGFSWAYWEFSAGFGIYNPTAGEFLDPLVNALFYNEMPEPTPVTTTPIYTSNFSSGTDGWNVNTQSGASGSSSASNNKLNIQISNGGTEGWNVQLIKNGIPLEKNKMYQVSFKAQAVADRSATCYVGKASSPWNAYSGYNVINIGTVEQAHIFTFYMVSPTDPIARIVFDLGGNDANLTISEVKVEKIEIGVGPVEITALEDRLQEEVSFYPNPVKSILYFNEKAAFEELQVYHSTGMKIGSYRLDPFSNSVNLESLRRGVYILRFSNGVKTTHVNIMKE